MIYCSTECVDRYECFFGRRAATNICVTKAMREDLAYNWGIKCDYYMLFGSEADILNCTELSQCMTDHH